MPEPVVSQLQCHLVGGAVRDKLLGLPVEERDWVVVGSSPKQMLALGYTQVGLDFPVFLHPQTREEYALARTERKNGSGYSGFSVHAAPHITLEQDLLRRDLTINAMAMTATGQLVDPYGGQQDIQSRQLRHVSSAFNEDPLRVLRLARFAAYLQQFGFTIATPTLQLVLRMVSEGELKQLVPERIWRETHKALQTRNPEIYFYWLHHWGALQQLMPECDQLFRHTHSPLQPLQLMSQLNEDPSLRLASLLFQLNQNQIKNLGQRFRIPKSYLQLAHTISRYQYQLRHYTALQAKQKHQLLQATRLLREPHRLADLIQLCAVISAQEQRQPTTVLQSQCIMQDIHTVNAVAVKELMAQGLAGKVLGDALKKAQVQVLEFKTHS
jgi:tRNA nucleotidyltransferase (CCA-adding enzyme)